jgi:predicted kinase
MVRIALTKEIVVVEGGQRRKVTAYEAIVRQLSIKAAQDQRKALRVLIQYQRLARKYGKAPRVSIVFETPSKELAKKES